MAHNNHHDNPWEDQPGRTGSGHEHPETYQAYQGQSHNPASHTQHQSYSQQPLPQHQDTSPWSQEPSQHQSHNPYDQQHQPMSSYGQDSTHPSYQQTAPQQPHSGQEELPPGLPPRRTATEMALPTGQDRSHQIEVMQSYEAAGRKDEDDSNVEILQREFPNIDGSLIAAIYGDSKSLSATREMLQALE